MPKKKESVQRLKTQINLEYVKGTQKSTKRAFNGQSGMNLTKNIQY